LIKIKSENRHASAPLPAALGSADEPNPKVDRQCFIVRDVA
jgi:hypothetical protein